MVCYSTAINLPIGIGSYLSTVSGKIGGLYGFIPIWNFGEICVVDCCVQFWDFAIVVLLKFIFIKVEWAKD